MLLVTDQGIARAGHAERAITNLKRSNLPVALFDQVVENPTASLVAQCAEFAREHRIDAIVGLGGGSSLDTARGCNMIYTHGGTMKDYWGVGKCKKPLLPMIAIPTTAGTGSECQSFALISDDETHVKMACGDPKAAAKAAILDPVLTLSQPERVAACSGIDALAHALESAVSKKRTTLSWMFSKESFLLAQRALPEIVNNPACLTSRGAMLLSAAYAGIAIENSMLGAAHATANPLTARYDVIHGQAVGLMLPHVIRYNAQHDEAARTYRQLAVTAGLASENDPVEIACEALIERLQTILDALPLKQRLSEFDITPDQIPQLAKEAAKQWTGQFNPRPVDEETLHHLYASAI